MPHLRINGFAVAVCLLRAAAANLAEPTVGGKYTDLASTLLCTRDEQRYGSFNDWGYWAGSQWCNQQTVSGYWVYLAPTWHIWHKELEPCSRNHGVLLSTIKCVKDMNSYGPYTDWGMWGPGSWCGQQAPRGYWVYIEDTWHIYEEFDEKYRDRYGCH